LEGVRINDCEKGGGNLEEGVGGALFGIGYALATWMRKKRNGPGGRVRKRTGYGENGFSYIQKRGGKGGEENDSPSLGKEILQTLHRGGGETPFNRESIENRWNGNNLRKKRREFFRVPSRREVYCHVCDGRGKEGSVRANRKRKEGRERKKKWDRAFPTHR